MKNKHWKGFNSAWVQRSKPRKKCDRCEKPLTKLFYCFADTFPENSEEVVICEKCGISFNKWFKKYSNLKGLS